MSQITSALFDSYDEARRAVERLEAIGVPSDDISILTNEGNSKRAAPDPDGETPADHKLGDDAGRGAGVGAIVGGAGGLLTGLGLLVIPGIGPILATGWLVTTSIGVLGGAAVGLVAGGAAGGIVAMLMNAGVADDDANAFAEGVRRGATLVSVKVSDKLAKETLLILKDDRTVDIAKRGAAYRAEGWTAFDPNAKPYVAETVVEKRVEPATV